MRASNEPSLCYVDADRIPAKLKCMITGEPPLEARVHGACNALFERTAIEQWVAGKREPTYPNCRATAPLSAFAAVGIVQIMLDELRVHCSEPACTWIGERGGLTEHAARFCEPARSRAALEAKRCAMEQELAAEQRPDMDLIRRVFEDLNPKADELARFSCMGVPVHVPRRIIRRYPDSVLEMMLDGRLTPNRNANGEIILQVSPDVMRTSMALLGDSGEIGSLGFTPCKSQLFSVFVFVTVVMQARPRRIPLRLFEDDALGLNVVQGIQERVTWLEDNVRVWSTTKFAGAGVPVDFAKTQFERNEFEHVLKDVKEKYFLSWDWLLKYGKLNFKQLVAIVDGAPVRVFFPQVI